MQYDIDKVSLVPRAYVDIFLLTTTSDWLCDSPLLHTYCYSIPSLGLMPTNFHELNFKHELNSFVLNSVYAPVT
jgi:hypothetical protein